MDLSIILPAYLEEENLRLLLPRIKANASDLTDSFEIIIVDTQIAMDGTPKVCEEMGVTYLNRTGGDCYGDAIRSGIDKSSGKYVIFMDADGSHHPEFIKELYRCRKESDVVIASRYVSGGHTENSKILVMMSKIVNIGYALVLNINCKDVSNSYKLYDGEALRCLKLRCSNFDVVEEILYKLMRNNKHLKIKELPFTFKQRMFGDTKRNLMAFVFGYILTLFRLRFMR